MAGIIFKFMVLWTFVVLSYGEGSYVYDEHGFEVQDRRHIDSWSNTVHIPRPDQPLLEDGPVAKWSFYARRTGRIYLQIWRKQNKVLTTYKLIGQDLYQISHPGLQSVTSKSAIEAKKGDVIGFYFPGRSIIPFDGEECERRRGLYYTRVGRLTSPMKIDRDYYFHKENNPCREYSVKVYIIKQSDTNIYDEYGFAVHDRRNVDTWSNAVYIPRPDQPIPRNGFVAKWSFYARSTGLLYLQFWRKGNALYKLIGQDQYRISHPGIQIFTSTSNIEVKKGDVIGFYFPGKGTIPFDGEECDSRRGLYKKRFTTRKMSPGNMYYFAQQHRGWKPCREYSLKVYLTHKTGGTCCYKKHAGEAVVGRVLYVLVASTEKCEKTCCTNKECLSFSMGESAGSPFCVLQSSSKIDDVLVKKDPKFNHYEKDKCS